jgi:hypothetical protein
MEVIDASLQLHHYELAGTALTDIRTIVELIASTTADSGPRVQAADDPRLVRHPREDHRRPDAPDPLTRHDWHDDSNRTITPAAA